MVYQRIFVIVVAYIADLLFGDPLGFPHLVVAMGKTISFGEKKLRRLLPETKNGELVGGAVLGFFTPLLFALTTVFLLHLLKGLSVGFSIMAEIFITYQILATTSLKQAGETIYAASLTGNLIETREALSHVVGRRTEELSMPQLLQGGIETLAENTSDGIVAPLFYLLIGGAPLGVFYKAVNTLDSMIAYKNEKYLYFGRYAAYQDDVFNWVPARITGILFVVAAHFMGLDGTRGWRIMTRDAAKHQSPNAGFPEAAVAGILGITLGGESVYQERTIEKAVLGDSKKKIDAEDLKTTLELLSLVSLLAFIIGTFTLYMIRR